MTYDIAYSILVHENIDFFEFQLNNIFKYNQGKQIYIITHFNFDFWNNNFKKIDNLCKKYNINYNKNKYNTSWCSSEIFDAIVSNMSYLLKNIKFKYYTMLSSNELFIRDGFLQFLDSLNFDLIHFGFNHYKNNPNHCERDLKKINLDLGLQKFLKINDCKSFQGFDFGRVLNYKYTQWLFNQLNNYWSFPITPSIKNYSMSECVIDTVLATARDIKVIDNYSLVFWYNNQKIQEILNYSEYGPIFLIKHIPRDLNHGFIKSFKFI